MYSSRDFRYLIEDPTKTEEATKSIAREPFTEVLYHWKKTSKPQEKFKIYQRGIENAIAEDRYPGPILDYVNDFPEFYSAVRDGLARLFISLRFSLNFQVDDLPVNDLPSGPTLYVDMIYGSDFSLTDEEKLDLLRSLEKGFSQPLVIRGKTYQTGVKLSSKALDISSRFLRLQNITYRINVRK